MQFVTQSDCQNEAGGNELGAGRSPRIQPKRSPGEETQNEVLRDVAGLTADAMPKVQLRFCQEGEQELEDTLNKPGSIRTGEVVGGKKEDNEEPRDERNPGPTFNTA
jgi:hypothetical protein